MRKFCKWSCEVRSDGLRGLVTPCGRLREDESKLCREMKEGMVRESSNL